VATAAVLKGISLEKRGRILGADNGNHNSKKKTNNLVRGERRRKSNRTRSATKEREKAGVVGKVTGGTVTILGPRD